ncbi:hypothetical protein Dip518_000593 [Parelusimicrobium proximum]|uniref:hypothetical protein n=1 Tax=Parelusimicrobium proximum TaxID=3228953 RepID=UPI003D18292E
MNKKLLIILAVVVIGAGGWFGYNYYMENQQTSNRLAAANSVRQNDGDTYAANQGIDADLTGGVMASSQDENGLVGLSDTTPLAGEMPASLPTPAAPAAVPPAPPASIPEHVVDAAPEQKVIYNPQNGRDPTFSKADQAFVNRQIQLQKQEEERRRQAQLAEQRRRDAELQKQRELEEWRAKNPAWEVQNKIHVSGIVGQEAFINGKVYGVGDSVLGARITRVTLESVSFIYKGQRFTKQVK